MATIVNARDVILQAAPARVAGVMMADNLEVSPDQVTGLGLIIEGTRSLEVSADSLIFAVNTAGTPSPSSVTLTATLKNITGTPAITVLAGSLSSVPTFSGTTATLPYANVTSTQVTLRVSVTDGGDTFTDDISITKLFETTSGINGLLTNESHTLPGDSLGNVTNYAGASGLFKVYQGTVDVSSSCTFAIASGGNPFSLTTSIHPTTGAYSVTGAYPTGDDVVTVLYEATYGSTVIPKLFTVTKAKAGVDGDDGVNGTRTAVLEMYQWASSAPATFPSGTSTYTWATGQFIAPGTPNGWTIVPGTPAPGDVLYVVRQLYADTGTSATTVVTWAATSSAPAGGAGVDGSDGANGQRVGLLEVYQWASTAPTSYPSGTSTYTWATGAFTAPSTPNGWSLTPGAAVAGQTLWAISVRVSDNLTTTTSTATWSSSTVYAAGSAGTNGTNGTNGTDGERGSRTFYVALSGATATYSDALATSTASVDGGPVLTDVVTQYNNSVNFSQTKFWDGGTWQVVNAVVDGNLLVSGTVGATALAARSVETRHLKVNGGYGLSVWHDTNYLDTAAWVIADWGTLPTQGSISDGVSGGTTMRSQTGGMSSARGAIRKAVTIGRTYRISCRVRKSATANGTLYLRVDGSTSEASSYGEIVGSVEGVTPTNSFVLYSWEWVATTPYMSPMVLLNYGGSLGYHEAQDIRVEEMLDASLVVIGGLDASRIDTRNLTIKDGAGTVIFSAGVPLAASNITPSSGWVNSNISIASNGALSGAGGGSVTITGLGYLGDLQATADIRFVLPSGYTQTGGVVSKVSGSSAWDSTAVTTTPYTGGCFIQAVSSENVCAIGFDTSASTIATGYAGMDYALIISGTGIGWAIYQGGSPITDGSYTAGDVFGVVYDGSFVRYTQNGAVIRTSSATAGLVLYGHVAVRTVAHAIGDLRFGPYGNPSAVQPSNPINSGNVSTYIANAAIGTAQVSTLNASVITAGTITTDRLVANAATSLSATANIFASSAPSSGASSASVSAGGSGVYTFTTTGAPVTIFIPFRALFECYSSSTIRYVKVKVTVEVVSVSEGTNSILSAWPYMLTAYVEPGNPSNLYWAFGDVGTTAHYSAAATPGYPMPAGNYRLTFAADFTFYDTSMSAVTLTTGSGGNLVALSGDYLVIENKV